MRLPLAMVLLALLAGPRADARWDDRESGLPALLSISAGNLATAGNTVVVEDKRGRLYVGNDNILEFDGVQWTPIRAGAGTYISGLAVDEGNRVWCGGVNELGYLDEDTTGRRTFHSLRNELPGTLTSFIIRSVHRRAGRTMFVGEQQLFIWDGLRFEVQAMPVASSLSSFDFEDATYVSQPGVGLWRWDGAAPVPVALGGYEREFVRTAWRGSDGHAVYLTGKRLVHARGPEFDSRGEATIEELTRQRLGAAVPLPGGFVAITSPNNGVFVIDSDGTLVRQLDRSDGLPGLNCGRPSVLRDGRLWVPIGNYLCSLDARHVQTLFNASNGNGGDAVRVAQSPVAGTLSATIEGIHRLETNAAHGATFKRVDDVDGTIRDLHVLPDGSIAATTSSRLLQLGAGHPTVVVPRARYLVQIAAIDPSGWRLAVGEGNEISLFDLRAPEPRIGAVGGFPEPPTRIAYDGRGHLWASLRRSGVMDVALPPLSSQDRRQFAPGRELPDEFNDPAVFVLDGQVFAFTGTAIVRLPQPAGERAQIVLPGAGLLCAERVASGQAWAVAARPDREPRLVRLALAADGSLSMEVTDQVIRGVGNITEFSRTQDHVLWVGGFEGSARLDAREVRPEPAPAAPIVQSISWRTRDAVARLPLNGATLAFHRAGVVEFQLRDSADPFAPTQLIETRLVGSGEDWKLTGKTRSIAGLDEGRYTLEARAAGFLGNPGPVVAYAFTITPPWFRTPLAYAGYVLALAVAILGSVQWRTRRIRHQNLQLEQLVNRRTEELAQAVSARSAFLANMGHEIRNPLNGVVGLVDTLRARQLADEHRMLVERIGTCADQLISVIDDVMEYARIDAGRIALRLRAYAVREPVEAAVDIFRAARPDSRIEIEGDATLLDAHVTGDPDRVRHILVNYLANALKFGGNTPVQVAVRRDGPLLVLSVTDHGPGIAPEEQAKLFVRFSRGSLAYKNAVPGTGLGLAACKAYAEAMGGDVSVESEPGRGATFFLRVPFQAATAEPAEAAPVASDVLVGRKVLVVDDQDFNRLVLCDLLGRMGASAVQASSVTEGREAFRAHSPDLVFVDFDLAGETGADLAEWIRKEAPSARDVPIVATTAFEIDEVRRRCTEAAMDGFLAKPVTAQRLLEVISRIEAVRSGGTSRGIAAAEPSQAPSSFLDILAGGDPTRRREIERSTWREVLTEALAAHRALRRGDAALTARHAHRLVSAALILSERELVVAARELNAVAKAGDLPAARARAERLRNLIRQARRPRVVRG